MWLNALAQNGYNEIFIKWLKIISSYESKENDIGFLLLWDNYDEYEIPLLPWFSVIAYYIWWKQFLFMKGKEERIFYTFKEYIALFFSENIYSSLLKSDSYWSSLFYDEKGQFQQDSALFWMTLFTSNEQDVFWWSLQKERIVYRQKFLNIIQ